MTAAQVAPVQVAMPPPKFATARNPERPTLGTRQAAFSRIWLRSDFMPHQRLIADVAGELNPDGTPAYPLVVVTEPRQAGKSHQAMAKNGERCLSVPGWRSWYTAQTGGDAADQFLKFADEIVAPSPLNGLVKVLRGNGHQAMRFPNLSTIRPHPPTEDALHGKQVDGSDIDEGWAFSEDEGKALLQAIAPAQLTRPWAQTWIWSAGGTAASTWLAKLVARGRAGDPAIAYFEWGIPDDFPLDDLEGIASFHPAYGHTISLQSIRNLRAQLEDDAEFARAAGNRWTEVIGGVISGESWEAVRTDQVIPPGVPVGYGTARAADGSIVATAAAGRLEDGTVVAEILEVRAAAHAAPAVAAWARDGAVGVAQDGPSRTLADALERERCQLLRVPSGDYSAACSNMLDALKPRTVRYRPHPDLDAAVKVAATRPSGDGGIAFARTGTGGAIPPLEAVTLALWALDHRPPPEPAPMSVFAG